MKQKDRLELAQKYILEDPTKPIEGLDKGEQKTVENLRECFNYLTENPLATYKERRKYLCKKLGITAFTAYNYITVCEMLLGNTSLQGKNLAKIRVASLLDEEYACIKNEDYKGADARHRLVQDYIKAFRLDIDEGEMMNAKEALTIPKVIITTDLSAIGIHPSEHELREQERLKREANYEEPEIIETIDIDGDVDRGEEDIPA